MRGTRSNDVILEDCFVPEESFVFATESTAAFYERAAHWEIGYMAVYLGVGAAAYRIACETLSQRVPRGFAQAMSYHPDLRRRVAEMSGSGRRRACSRASPPGGPIAKERHPRRWRHCCAPNILSVRRSTESRAARSTRAAHTRSLRVRHWSGCSAMGTSASIMPPSGDACLFGIGVLELGLNPKEMLPPLKAVAKAGRVGP